MCRANASWSSFTMAKGACSKACPSTERASWSVAYDARGRCTLTALGNGLVTRTAYDPETAGIRRVRTERCQRIGDLTYHPTDGVLQNLGYAQDLAGNLHAVRDRVTGRGIPGSVAGPDELRREYEY